MGGGGGGRGRAVMSDAGLVMSLNFLISRLYTVGKF